MANVTAMHNLNVSQCYSDKYVMPPFNQFNNLGQRRFQFYYRWNFRIQSIEPEDWKRKFWFRDEMEKYNNRNRNDDDKELREWSKVDNVKKSSTVLTRRRFPDGIGVLRLSFSSPGK